MPNFDITITHTVTQFLTFTVKAKDNATAQDKVEKRIEDCDHLAEKVSKFYKADWDEESDEWNVEVTEE